jgi:hypothetical protein
VTVGLFGLVAVATAHEHWLKEQPDVLPITGPLKAWIDQLPAKTLKRLEQNLAPTLLVVGIATVVGPDAVLEMRLRANEKRLKPAVPAPPAGRNGQPVAAPGGVPAAANGAHGHAAGGDGWYSGIPTSAALRLETDAGY